MTPRQRLSSVMAKDPDIFAWMILDAQGDLTIFYQGYVEEYCKTGPTLLADPD